MKRSFIIMSLAALVVVVLDQVTKLLISSNLALGQTAPIIDGYVQMRYTQNTGAAFGIFADSTGILSIISLLVIAGMLIVFVRLGKLSLLSVIAAGLVLGGALGNLADRVRLRYVVDFIEVYRPQITINNTVYIFPVFNVADSAITVGVIFILIGLLFGKTSEPAPAIVDAATPPASPGTSSPAESEVDTDRATVREF